MAPSVPFTAPASSAAPLAVGPAAASLSSPVAAPRESSEAAQLVQKVAALADRVLTRPTEQISVRIDLDDTSHVDVRIALHAGKVQADFQTNSPSLRTALADAWQDFARQSPAAEQRWGDPTFTTLGHPTSSPLTGPSSAAASAQPADSTTAFGTDQGSARREPPARFTDLAPGPSTSRASASSLPSGPSPHLPTRRPDHTHHLDLFA